MDFIPKKNTERGRRTQLSRRESQREEEKEKNTDRRASEDRRDASLARAFVHMFNALWLTPFSAGVKVLVRLKLFELCAMIVSALLTAAAYSITMSPVLAISLVLILIVHESGHYIAARLRGYPSRLWLHIPFFGARMEAHEFRSCDDEACIAYGGPLLGGCCSLLLFVLWLWLPLEGSERYLLYVVSIASAVLNLFNLVPLLPFDGGRIMHTVLPRLSRIVGFSALLAVSFFFKEAAFLVVWILVVGYLSIPPSWRFRIACILLAAMPILMWLGYRGAHLWEDGIYLAFGALLVKTIHTLTEHPEINEEKSGVVEMTHTQRICWAWRFWGLVLALSALIGAHFALFTVAALH